MINEKTIEEILIAKLEELKYTIRLDIRDRQSLELNFRQKFNALNRVNLTDSEFSRLRDEIITSDVFTASKRLREINTFRRDDDTPLHYTLVNLKDWCKNDFEVVRQLRINTENSHHRFDVILLINGIPLVQIELKTISVDPRRAMQQIVDYKKDAGNGFSNSLLCFMQLFIVSNRHNTYYFSNNNNRHFTFNVNEQFLPVYKFANDDNTKVDGLEEFAEKFLAKCTLAQMISRYMVLVETESKLMVMRPYQIYAVKAIVDCIQQNRGNGYIWHTTGSGKTLTSFKASTLLKDNPDIEKCLFVVDRKDLDRQTRDEFNRFQKDCVEQNTNTETLVSRLLSDDKANKLIVTTIQKLGLALDPDRKDVKGKISYQELLKPLSQKRIVFIFDECHRSQFGDNHKYIKEFFPNAQLFGFTGTPIFDDNAIFIKKDGQEASYKTTKDIFEKKLHTYTIIDAIADKNVLPFHIDYFEPKDSNAAQSGEPLSQKAVVESILDKHDKATNNRLFNAILATDSIDSAIKYYELFKKIQAEQQEADTDFRPLRIACVFSPPPKIKSDNNAEDEKNSARNEADIKQLQEDLPYEERDNKEHPEKNAEALKSIIADYNKQYDTNHRIYEFDDYYKDIQKRIKDQKYSKSDYPQNNKIDITIVVDMLLTGFDSPYLNTLYVDKNLRYHGLIQAFSRTNRILNRSKPFGNILDFRNQGEAVDKAIMLFSGKNLESARQIWEVETAVEVIKNYHGAVLQLDDFMNDENLLCEPSQLSNLKGTTAEMEFIKHFKEVQRIRTQLDQYTDLTSENINSIEKLLPNEHYQAFKTRYLQLARDFKKEQEKNSDPDAPVNQLEFEFVLFGSALIDYDYIMQLIAKITQGTSKQNITRAEIINLISSNANFDDDIDDLKAYINNLDLTTGKTKDEISEGFQQFKAQKEVEELNKLAETHNLEATTLHNFVQTTLDRKVLDANQLSDLFAPLGLGWKIRAEKELALMHDLIPILKHRASGSDISGLSAYDNKK